MMFKKNSRLLILLLAISLLGCQAGFMKPSETSLPMSAGQPLIRVTVTSQGYYYHRPWEQRRPSTRNAIGVIVTGGHVLVTGLMVANHRYIELETLDTNEKQQAKVVVVDYEANLALLKPEDPDFLKGRKPMELASKVQTGDNLKVIQVKPTGDIVAGFGEVTAIELRAYAMGNYFLAYRLNCSLQYRLNNQTLPVIKRNSLAGLLLGFSSDKETRNVIPLPVIRHFLEDASKDNYEGFPLAGFRYGDITDPQLRRYIELPEDLTGIYVHKVIKGGPADRAGLQPGDVITNIDEHDISATGRYNHPFYGKTSVTHLIRTGYHVGDQVMIQIFRKQKLIELPVILDHRNPEEFLVPPYILDRAPDYRIVGGLLMQELSLDYIREYGKNWSSIAPVHLLYYNENQDYLEGHENGGKKIVIVTGIIPTPYTIGLEKFSNLVVKRINGKQIRNLADIAPALEKPVNGFHKIEVDQHPRIIYLDPEQIPNIHKLIEKRYRIPIQPVIRSTTPGLKTEGLER
ncbi:MAG: PDZ domain-containing protein [Desulfobacteraceae bacterium]|nr:PDZ domain-containing protein [Desulfobacteraceae bacterium]